MQRQQVTIFCVMEHSIYRIRIACEVGQSKVAITSSGLQCVTQLLPGREIQTIFVIIICLVYVAVAATFTSARLKYFP